MRCGTGRSAPTTRVRITRRPPLGMASRALMARFNTARSISAGSTRMRPPGSGGTNSSCTSSPITLTSMGSMDRTMLSGSTTPGWPTWRCPMARSWLVRAAARCPARWIASTSVTRGSAGSIERSRISLHPRMTVSRLSKSCATPPARRAMAPRRSACWNCSSMRWRSVTSSATARMPVTAPSWSRSGAVDTDSWSTSSWRRAAELHAHGRLPVSGAVPEAPTAEAATSSAAGMRRAPSETSAQPEDDPAAPFHHRAAPERSSSAMASGEDSTTAWSRCSFPCTAW